MEEILIPMECLFDIPSLNHMMMPSYKKGDIFLYNPHHEVHVELEEHGVFKEIDNDLCDFICEYPNLLINETVYNIGQKLSKKDIDSFDTETLKNLYYIGYIKKVLKQEANNKKSKTNSPKKKNAKKAKAETFATLAKKLNKTNDEFKKAVFDALDIEIKDMRKKVPSKLSKKIIGALK